MKIYDLKPTNSLDDGFLEDDALEKLKSTLSDLSTLYSTISIGWKEFERQIENNEVISDEMFQAFTSMLKNASEVGPLALGYIDVLRAFADSDEQEGENEE